MKVKLLNTHTHEGKDYVAGDEIELPSDSAQWLIDLKRAEEVAQPVKKSTFKPSEE